MRILSFALTVMMPAALAAQSAAPLVLSEADEIALARSAAPANVSDGASVLVLRGPRYETAVHGSTDVMCMVSRTHPLSIEPICYDAEASRTVRFIDVARVQMRLDGVPQDQIDKRIKTSIAEGTIPAPSRPAMAYMMSSRQVLYADAETRVGAWMPHIHIYIPYATAEQFGGFSDEMVPSIGTVVDSGEATANLVVRVRDFTKPTASR